MAYTENVAIEKIKSRSKSFLYLLCKWYLFPGSIDWTSWKYQITNYLMYFNHICIHEGQSDLRWKLSPHQVDSLVFQHSGVFEADDAYVLIWEFLHDEFNDHIASSVPISRECYRNFATLINNLRQPIRNMISDIRMADTNETTLSRILDENYDSEYKYNNMDLHKYVDLD